MTATELRPYYEPMTGQRTGVNTSILIQRHGPIIARGYVEHYQFIAFSSDLVFESTQWSGDVWLPWSRRPCHDYTRLAKLMKTTLEVL